MGSLRWLAFFIVGGVASAASADWQYTKWNMSREQVIAASKQAATDLPIDPSLMDDPILAAHRSEVLANSPTLHAPYLAGGRRYDAQFTFHNDRLQRVSLNGVHGLDCYQLRDDMLSRYGTPDDRDDSRDAKYVWRLKAEDNTVTLAIPKEEGCFVTYEPFTLERAKGL